jgi:hypothetical protein
MKKPAAIARLEQKAKRLSTPIDVNTVISPEFVEQNRDESTRRLNFGRDLYR